MEMEAEVKSGLICQCSYRGYVLKAIPNPTLETWTLSYNLGNHPPAMSRFEWQNPEEAIDHGKRMIDSLLGDCHSANF